MEEKQPDDYSVGSTMAHGVRAREGLPLLE
jgi:hypothetical protein